MEQFSGRIPPVGGIVRSPASGREGRPGSGDDLGNHPENAKMNEQKRQ